MNAPRRVKLKPGRDKPVRHGHPWVFSGAVAEMPSAPVGAVVDVVSHTGNWLARGLLNPGCALSVRVYTRDENQPLDEAFFAGLVDRALAWRAGLLAGESETSNAHRLIFSEADGISGLIVDRYADALAVQVGAAALLPFLPAILNQLRSLTGVQHLHVGVDEDDATREGLEPGRIAAFGTPDLPPVGIRENGLQFEVDLGTGQKTGFYLDQRVNRKRVAEYARGRRVLSAYCYTGAFEVHCAAAGAASITGIDRSEAALDRARRHFELNALTPTPDYIRADAPEALRRLHDAGTKFDLIVLDPPRFVANRAQKPKGLRAYKDINLWALKLLAPGGLLATFSCSGLVTATELRTAVAWAALDAGRAVRVLETFSQAPDHPILLSAPESDYLKGLLCLAT